MTSSTRQGRTLPCTAQHDFPEPIDPEPVPSAAPLERLTPPDPVVAAVKLLLGHALAAADLTIGEAARDSAVTVILLPSLGWSQSACDEWTSTGRHGEKAEDGFSSRPWQRERSDWIAFQPREMPRPPALVEAADRFAEALAEWRHCVGLSPDFDWLPRDLVTGADHRLIMPSLTPADVNAVALEICGGDEADATISIDEAAALTPRHLRLAHRPAQTASMYIRRLRELLDHHPVAVMAASIRDSPTLDRLHGMDDAVQWGMSLATDIERYRAGAIPWAAVDRGLLLSGPPGCGKTLFARGLAATCRVPLVSGSYSQWYSTGGAHQGDLLKAMIKTFQEARKRAPCVLFIDEVDSFPNRATITHHYADWEIQVVNALLAEIDGVEGRDGVVLVAACNFPEKLDPALVRSGRLDRHLRIGLPTRAALAEMLREHLGDDLPGEDLLTAALMAAGSTGADSERFVRGARRRARNAERPLLLEDLLAEIVGRDVRTQDEWQITSVHEAGHAVALGELNPGALDTVTLVSNDVGGGGTRGGRLSSYFTARDVHRRLVVMLAGRAAEESVLGKVTSGAGGGEASDLARATILAATAVASDGLDEKSGLLWHGVGDVADLQRLLTARPALAVRVGELIDEAYADALVLMSRRSAAVRKVAEALLEKRALDGKEVAAILADCPADPLVAFES